jgi:ABC-2 type transport system ATP-binding protein
MIEVERLGKRYGDVDALAGVSFAVGRGEIVALLGPNGAGKTTTIEILEGFRRPTTGTARVLGVDPRRGDRAWRARIGLVLQSTSLAGELTVREALAAFAGVFPRPRSVAEVLELVDLVEEADTRIGRLSGGQQRRVDLGIGIVGRPDVLFLDEPTTGLDPTARRRSWDTVAALAADGTTVLLTTHSLEEAERLAGRMLVLAHGTLVADATPTELRASGARPTLRYTPSAGAELPEGLRRHLDGGELVVRGGDLEPVLAELLAARLDLAGLTVEQPSLEDAYLALTG